MHQCFETECSYYFLLVWKKVHGQIYSTGPFTFVSILTPIITKTPLASQRMLKSKITCQNCQRCFDQHRAQAVLDLSSITLPFHRRFHPSTQRAWKGKRLLLNLIGSIPCKQGHIWVPTPTDAKNPRTCNILSRSPLSNHLIISDNQDQKTSKGILMSAHSHHSAHPRYTHRPPVVWAAPCRHPGRSMRRQPW